MEVIDANTLVPIGLIVMLSGTVIGAVIWLTNLHSLTKDNAKRISELELNMNAHIAGLKIEVDALKELYTRSSERMIRIESCVQDIPAIKQSLMELTLQLAKMAGAKEK